MTRSWFIRPLPLRPLRCLVPADARAYLGVRPAPVQPMPARFAVGLAERASAGTGALVSELEAWALRPAPPAAARVTAAPVNLRFYLGRVVELDPDGGVVATLWERPSGREFVAVLDWEAAFGAPPGPEDELLLWTWVELPGEGRVHERRWLVVRAKPVTSEDQGRLRALLAGSESGS